MPMYALTKVLYNVPKITSGNIILYHRLVDHKVIPTKVSCMLSIVVGKWDEAMQHYAGNENFRRLVMIIIHFQRVMEGLEDLAVLLVMISYLDHWQLAAYRMYIIVLNNLN